MKPEEAIEELNHELLILECLIEEVNSFICDCDVDDDEYDDKKEQFEISLTRYKKEKEVIEMAISAIKELQQYHEIGTVEECRKAAEKQKPKKRIYPKTALERYYHAPECPNCKRELKPRICGYALSQAIGIYSYCPWCGQNLEGGEESEE